MWPFQTLLIPSIWIYHHTTSLSSRTAIHRQPLVRPKVLLHKKGSLDHFASVRVRKNRTPQRVMRELCSQFGQFARFERKHIYKKNGGARGRTPKGGGSNWYLFKRFDTINRRILLLLQLYFANSLCVYMQDLYKYAFPRRKCKCNSTVDRSSTAHIPRLSAKHKSSYLPPFLRFISTNVWFIVRAGLNDPQLANWRLSIIALLLYIYIYRSFGVCGAQQDNPIRRNNVLCCRAFEWWTTLTL